MISLEQVQLLESRVSKALEYVQKVNAENAALVSQREELQAKLEANQKRIDELEVLVMRFKKDQGRIEDGIVAALDRLSQFEEAFEDSLKEKTPHGAKKPAAKQRAKQEEKLPPSSSASSGVYFEIPEKETNEVSANLEEELSSEGELDIF
ncbi:MAG: cell division protein ZapB [Treponema sp.]|jgi:predicted nuclease with TOPRIM domain|nr:cell division protein ZapB [Treponema sp.]